MTKPVPASEFTRNFGRYRMLAQRDAVPVTSHGEVTGYFVHPGEYELFMRYKSGRRVVPTAELDDGEVAEVIKVKMHPRHNHLNKLLAKRK